MKNTLLILTIWAVAAGSALGQTNTDQMLKAVLQKPTISFHANMGQNFTKSVLDSGQIALLSRPNKAYMAGLEYSHPLHNNLSLLVGIDIGSLANHLRAGFVNNLYHAGPMDYNHFYSSLSLGLGKAYQYDGNYFIKPSMLLTIMCPRQMGFAGSVSGYRADSAGLPNSSMNYDGTANSASVLAHAKIDIGKMLPNGDLVSMQLGYKQGFTNALLINYVNQPNDANLRSKGHLINRGTMLYMGLNYTFGNYSKYSQTTKLAKKDKKTTTNSIRKELETKRSHSFKAEVGVGTNFFRQRIKNPYYYIGSLSGPALTKYVDLSWENEKFGVHTAIFVNDIFTSDRNKYEPGNWSGYGYDRSWQLNLGLSKSIRNLQQNRQLFTVEGGLSVSIMNISGQNHTEPIRLANTTVTSNLKGGNKVYPLAYVGISSTIHVYDMLYLNYGAQYYQGFSPFLKNSLTYTQNGTVVAQNTRSLNGSYLVLKAGLAYYFNRG